MKQTGFWGKVRYRPGADVQRLAGLTVDITDTPICIPKPGKGGQRLSRLNITLLVMPAFRLAAGSIVMIARITEMQLPAPRFSFGFPAFNQIASCFTCNNK
jgi:hypothetical protein